ncbi:hypothetical protein QMK19_39315, partial [Streptomyces sp. H10-C2]|uniref:hypothetical protein n=1 Tax=Streptomyces sp. H10-C2 TaxID=3046210 RepID=UPI0024BB1D96
SRRVPRPVVITVREERGSGQVVYTSRSIPESEAAPKGGAQAKVADADIPAPTTSTRLLL